jgi:SAM-dependent methyltransferase
MRTERGGEIGAALRDPESDAPLSRGAGDISEDQIAAFWQAHPCGDQFVDGAREDFERFFARYDSVRYGGEAHIPACLRAMDVAGKRILEIGLGQGADSEQLIRLGAIWSGLDLTPESVNRVAMRLMLRRLPYESIKVGSALRIPHETASFDVVFSHGVLHHVPDIRSAQSEIHRVLKRDGRLVVMLYAKYSLNYLLSIFLLRRLGLIAMYLLRPSARGIYAAHLAGARELGLARYLRMRNFIHRNTDGPYNPYSKVYSVAEVRRDFPDFRIERVHKEYLHAPPLKVHSLPGASLLGWHLWVHMIPK